jgi:GNAT superfamily N-acetyltransferase
MEKKHLTMSKQPFTTRPFNFSPEDYHAVIAIWDRTWPNLKGQTDAKRPPNAPIERHVALLHDEIIAFGDIRRMLEAEDEYTYYLTLNVVPEHRNQGIGSSLFDLLLDQLKSRKARQVITDTYDTYPHSIAFLTGRDFCKFMRYPYSILDVTQFDFSRFSQVAEKMKAMGIQIKSIAEAQQDDPAWMEKLWRLDTLILQDTPSPVEEKQLTLEEFEKMKINSTWFNPQAWFIALDGDQWIGESALETITGNREKYWTHITGVIADYRRRGIATALKLHVIDFARCSGVKFIQTSNEEHNPMYGINKLLGFTSQPAEVLFRRYL